MRDTFADAIAALPFDGPTALRLLAPVVAAAGSPSRVDADKVATQLLIAPLHPTLRTLSTHEAAEAWVLVDFLRLGAAARRLEDDLVQRFVEWPGAEASWRDALTVDGYPACDTL